MTYLGAFFTHLIGLVVMVAAFLGLRNLGLGSRALLSTLAFFLVTLVMVKLLAKIGTGRAVGASVCFWIYNLALNCALWFLLFQPEVEAEGE